MIVIRDAQMKDYLWYKIGGNTRYLLQCFSEEDIVEAFEFIKKEKIDKYFVVGMGSNLLFTDGYFDGVVIQILVDAPSVGITLLNKETVQAFSGVELDSVIQFAFDKNLLGLEWAGGLPGTVGAAVRGNVGAFGGEIKDSFKAARVLVYDKKKYKVLDLNKRDIKFAYRNSTVKKQKNMVILSVTFKLNSVDDKKLGWGKQTYFANIEYRKSKHPMDFPSTGSAFKNINNPGDIKKVLTAFPDIESDVRVKWHGKVSMGYLNKRLDLSGLKIGQAHISNKHSNFIVNLG
nr:UDP-N-acetylmuramate dehydrogenase [Candidatus Levybacteria bacterium]